MPVTFYPAKHAAKPFDQGYPSQVAEDAATHLLKMACYEQYRQCDEILQSSFKELDFPVKKPLDIIPQNNGFVHTVTQAYNHHRALVIRPDDVWLAILTQFSAFINANAEVLRSQFVRHQGKKELTVVYNGERRKVDYGDMANKMTKEIENNITDPALRTWILPDFTTTTTNDTIVCSIVMMATMKEYFSYKFHVLCGIPRVTLEGEKGDWEKILVRLEKLKEYGLQTIAWYHLLRPVILQFVKAFDAPGAQENLDFWQKVAHYEGGGSGPTYLGGWITAFCVFSSDKGVWLGNKFKQNAQESGRDPGSLSSADFFSTYLSVPLPPPILRFPRIQLHSEHDQEEESETEPEMHLQLDGATYHLLDTQDIPSGYSEVDILLVDINEEFKCMMVAGHVGMRVRSKSSGSNGDDEKMLGPRDAAAAAAAARDTVEPVAGWWMFTKQLEGKLRGENEEDTPVEPEPDDFSGFPPVRVEPSAADEDGNQESDFQDHHGLGTTCAANSESETLIKGKSGTRVCCCVVM